jgi:hypothetical protein
MLKSGWKRFLLELEDTTSFGDDVYFPCLFSFLETRLSFILNDVGKESLSNNGHIAIQDFIWNKGVDAVDNAFSKYMDLTFSRSIAIPLINYMKKVLHCVIGYRLENCSMLLIAQFLGLQGYIYLLLDVPLHHGLRVMDWDCEEDHAYLLSMEIRTMIDHAIMAGTMPGEIVIGQDTHSVNDGTLAMIGHDDDIEPLDEYPTRFLDRTIVDAILEQLDLDFFFHPSKSVNLRHDIDKWMYPIYNLMDQLGLVRVKYSKPMVKMIYIIDLIIEAQRAAQYNAKLFGWHDRYGISTLDYILEHGSILTVAGVLEGSEMHCVTSASYSKLGSAPLEPMIKASYPRFLSSSFSPELEVRKLNTISINQEIKRNLVDTLMYVLTRDYTSVFTDFRFSRSFYNKFNDQDCDESFHAYTFVIPSIIHSSQFCRSGYTIREKRSVMSLMANIFFETIYLYLKGKHYKLTRTCLRYYFKREFIKVNQHVIPVGDWSYRPDLQPDVWMFPVPLDDDQRTNILLAVARITKLLDRCEE